MNPLLSVLLSASIASLFVLSLYVWEVPRLLRGAPPANRDDPRVVCQRITSVLGSCVASAAIVACAKTFGLLDDSHAPLPSVPRLLSLQPDYLIPSLAFPLLLVVLLFLGPLILSAFNSLQAIAAARRENRHYTALASADGADGAADGGGAAASVPCASKPLVLPVLPSDLLSHVRNLVVAPLSEEFVFRAALCPLLLAGGFSVTSTVFICPLFFSLAHGHHIWNLVHYHRCSLPQALAMRSKWPSLAAHAFCNAMGVPDFQAALTHPYRYVICSSFVAGVVLFATLVNPLTDPPLFNRPVASCHVSLGFCKWQ
ncbi:unnamed protein product [Closterium sp. Yama58-4]|nr:unnamed protein product [Closterium sp. Yama58-4]